MSDYLHPEGLAWFFAAATGSIALAALYRVIAGSFFFISDIITSEVQAPLYLVPVAIVSDLFTLGLAAAWSAAPVIFSWVGDRHIMASSPTDSWILLGARGTLAVLMALYALGISAAFIGSARDASGDLGFVVFPLYGLVICAVVLGIIFGIGKLS